MEPGTEVEGEANGVLALELGSWPWITSLHQMEEGEGNERHRAIREYYWIELSAGQRGDAWV